MISTDNTIVVTYISKQGAPYSQLMHKGMEDPPMVPKHYIVVRICHIPGKFNVLVDTLSTIDNSQNRMGIGAIDTEFSFQMSNRSNFDLFATRFSHRLPLYVFPALDNKAFMIDAFSVNWNNIHAYAFPTTY